MTETYILPTEFPSAFNGLGERMLHSRIAIWSHLKSDYQVYDVNREDWPAIRLTPTNTDRTNPFYFAENESDSQSRTFTLYRPRARIHSHVDMAIWHTGGWLCRRQAQQLQPSIPILAVSDPAKLTWVGNVGLHRSPALIEWQHFQTPFFYRPIIHNRILTVAALRPVAGPDVSDSTVSAATPTTIPLFVAEALLEKAITAEETCPIAMDSLERGSACVTSCFHIFQREAMNEWMAKNSTCPVCKATCAITNC